MSEWKEVKISDIATYVNRGIAPKYAVNDGIPVINQKCIRNRNISNEFLKYHNNEKKHSPEKKLIEGDILINSTGVGTAERVGLFLLNDYTLADTHVSILRLNKNEAVPQYVFYNLRNREDELENTAEGSTGQIELKRDGIKDLDILLPPLPEQRAIASVLSSLDDKIDLLHRQNRTLEAMAETLFRQWFVEEADEGWENKKIGQLTHISSGKGLKKEEFNDTGLYPVLGANGEIGRTDNYLFDEKLIFTGRVGTLGKIFIVENAKVWLSDNTLVIRPKNNFYYVYFILKNYKLEEYNVGSTQPLIRQSDIKEIKVSFPTENILNLFENEAKTLFYKLNLNKNQIRTLEKLRDTLLPKLMSGEVRVEV